MIFYSFNNRNGNPKTLQITICGHILKFNEIYERVLIHIQYNKWSQPGLRLVLIQYEHRLLSLFFDRSVSDHTGYEIFRIFIKTLSLILQI